MSVSLTTAGLGVTLLLIGRVWRILGRTRLIDSSPPALVVVGLACAAAPNWNTLLALRLLQGIALAGLPGWLTAYLREEMHPDGYVRTAGLYVGGTALAGRAAAWSPGPSPTRPAGAGAGRRGRAGSAPRPAGADHAARLAQLRARPRPRHLVTMTRRALSDPGLLALYGIGACAMGAFVAGATHWHSGSPRPRTT